MKSEPGNLIQISKENIRHLLRKDIVPENTQIYLLFQPELVINNTQPPFIWASSVAVINYQSLYEPVALSKAWESSTIISLFF